MRRRTVHYVVGRLPKHCRKISPIGHESARSRLLGDAAAWPFAARAQPPERMRRIGVLMNMAADDPTGLTRLLAFAQALAQAGWTDGRNVRIDVELANTHRLPSMFIAKHWAQAVSPSRP